MLVQDRKKRQARPLGAEAVDCAARYVIDFYNAAPVASAPVAMHLDVRPALDSPGALWDRLRMQARWVRSGRWRRE